MYATGTQAKKWTFKDEHSLDEFREEANKTYIQNYIPYRSSRHLEFLSPVEEKLLCKYYEFILHDFCKKFEPLMPRSVISCSLHYYKRFFLKNSVMNYHPKHIIATCAFLACKVEEFNVSIVQFVSNVKGDRSKAHDIILNHELLLMEHMDYDLIVHHPFRPVEGFLIDMKARCPQIVNPERFRPAIEEFLNNIFFTDGLLLYAPSQIALAAITYAGKKFQENVVDAYVTEVLLKNSDAEKVFIVKDAIKKMLSMIASNAAPPRDQIKSIEKKLEMCRNEENNPNSNAYKRKLGDESLDGESSNSKQRR